MRTILKKIHDAGRSGEKRNLLGLATDVAKAVFKGIFGIPMVTFKIAKLIVLDPVAGWEELRYQTARLSAIAGGLIGAYVVHRQDFDGNMRTHFVADRLFGFAYVMFASLILSVGFVAVWPAAVAVTMLIVTSAWIISGLPRAISQYKLYSRDLYMLRREQMQGQAIEMIESERESLHKSVASMNANIRQIEMDMEDRVLATKALVHQSTEANQVYTARKTVAENDDELDTKAKALPHIHSNGGFSMPTIGGDEHGRMLSEMTTGLKALEAQIIILSEEDEELLADADKAADEVMLSGTKDSALVQIAGQLHVMVRNARKSGDLYNVRRTLQILNNLKEA